MVSLSNVLWVALGGAVGSGLRYLVAVASTRWTGSLPVGTLVVNVVGSFLLGALLQLFLLGDDGHPGPRLALTTGMMGGLTTYSTFNYELLTMAQAGRIEAAAAYLLVTVVACLAAGAVGLAAVRWLGG